MPNNQIEDDDQSQLLIQRELAKALRRSDQTVTDAQLPPRMVVLLLRLALHQLMRATIGKGWKERPQELRRYVSKLRSS